MTQESNNHYALIMAGGEGTRFQPISTPQKPKQFLHLWNEDKTLLQETYERLLDLFGPEKIWIGTNQRYKNLIQKQLPAVPIFQIIGESAKKNTAPCLAWVSYQLFQKNGDAIVGAFPSDHFITPEDSFRQTIQEALALAKKKQEIVTVGIKPTFPSSQYGYIQRTKDGSVECFIEKPTTQKAKQYLEDGNYFWNSGIFIFPVRTLLKAIQEFLPGLHQLLQKEIPLEVFFQKAPSISIDYGVLEKTKEIAMLEATFDWSDVGTWESLQELAEKYSLTLPKEVQDYLANHGGHRWRPR